MICNPTKRQFRSDPSWGRMCAICSINRIKHWIVLEFHARKYVHGGYCLSRHTDSTQNGNRSVVLADMEYTFLHPRTLRTFPKVEHNGKPAWSAFQTQCGLSNKWCSLRKASSSSYQVVRISGMRHFARANCSSSGVQRVTVGFLFLNKDHHLRPSRPLAKGFYVYL